MQIAVTGGNGDMGRALVPYLLAHGHAVVSLDRIMPSVSFMTSVGTARAMVADTRDFGQVVASLRDCDAVIHLAAHRSPVNAPDPVVYIENTGSSYNVLSAASALGIQRVCLASSINAIGGAFSRQPRYDYFPLDEQHPTYAEEPYALSKWVLEQQADAFARRYEWMTIASMRFHWLTDSRERAAELNRQFGQGAVRHLWAYTLLAEACRACLLALTADFSGHEALYIVAPRTIAPEPSLELARQYYPSTAIRGDLSDHTGFFNCAKAERVLGWRHED
jgi:nucleoside-diphosphate-sugar epimerase